MINLDADLGGVQLRGNLGLQYGDTTQKSTGTLTNFGVNNVKDSYDRWLPSANLAFEVADDTFVKLAFAKTITRPRLDQLAANQNIGFNTQSCADANLDQVPDTFVDFDPPSLVCFNVGGGRSEEHTSELQSLMRISYAVFCLKKKNTSQQSASNRRT